MTRAYALQMTGWIAKLSDEDRSEFIATLTSALEAGDREPIARLLAGWKATADVWADPELSARLRQEKHGPSGTSPSADHPVSIPCSPPHRRLASQRSSALEVLVPVTARSARVRSLRRVLIGLRAPGAS